MLVFPRHIRAAKLCHGGGRDWFAARGWSWAEFVAEGRPVEDFEECGCPLAARVAQAAWDEQDGETRLYLRHLGAVGFCHGGGREWFAERGWDWGDFVTNGRPLLDFVATGDPDAMRAVEAARREVRDGRQ